MHFLFSECTLFVPICLALNLITVNVSRINLVVQTLINIPKYNRGKIRYIRSEYCTTRKQDLILGPLEEFGFRVGSLRGAGTEPRKPWNVEFFDSGSIKRMARNDMAYQSRPTVTGPVVLYLLPDSVALKLSNPLLYRYVRFDERVHTYYMYIDVPQRTSLQFLPIIYFNFSSPLSPAF